MLKLNIGKVVMESRENAIEKYERFKGYTNTDNMNIRNLYKSTKETECGLIGNKCK